LPQILLLGKMQYSNLTEPIAMVNGEHDEQ